MTWKEWKIWFKATPKSARWFVILMLIRPLADNFYFLKNISALLSPLYIIGVATPVLCLYGISKLPKYRRSRADRVFGVWSFLAVMSTLFFIFADPLSTRSYEYLLKLTLPVYVFYFLRRMIRTRRDLDGLLQTFLYSGIFVVSIFMYEVLVNPISVQVSRGLERVQGSFGDVMNYAIYISFSFLIMAYRYIDARGKKQERKAMWWLLAVGGFCVLGLFRINHTATFGVFGMLIVMMSLYLAKANKTGAVVVLILTGIVLAFFGWDLLAEKLNPLVETDLAVYEGDLESSKLLHGRMGRWEYCLQVFSEFPVYAQFLGMPLKMDYAAPFVGVGVHNDFLRIMFLTGFFGLLAYLAVLFNFVRRIRGYISSIKFLCYGAFIILLMYSVTTTPTFYAPFMYLQLSVMAFLAIPKKKKI